MLTKLVIAFFSLTATQADEIGRKIWDNESRGRVDGLTCWNEGEEFASMGINHFIWYPANKRGPFEETFRSLLAYLQKHAVQVPLWLNDRPPCPWNSKKEFMRDIDSPRMRELQKFLCNTRSYQVQFMAERLDKILPKMLEAASEKKQKKVKNIFEKLLETPKGPYLLLDYYNFKGDGTWPSERYNDTGWGLLQVLEEMDETATQLEYEFAEAARRVLKKRTENAPEERNEQRWLNGWFRRIKTYE